MFRFTDNIIAQTTLQCNLNCKYCYEGSKIKANKKQMSVSDFKRALDTAIYQRCILGDKNNKLIWHFHGGEPFLYNWEDFKECIRYIHRRAKSFPNVTYCVQSNGLCINKEIAEFFAKEKCSIGISFDGFSTTERMSKEKTKALIESLRNLKAETGVRFSCLSVFSRANMDNWFVDMVSTSDLFDSFGINVLVPSEKTDNLAPTAEEQWKYWLEPCLKSYLTDNPLKERFVNMMVERFFTDVILHTEDTEVKKTGCFDRICGHGVNMINIDPSLNVHNCDKYLEEGNYICNRYEEPLNSYDFLGLEQIKRYGEYCKNIFELEHKTGCNRCYASNLCLGGCQSYNLSRYNEYRLDTTMCDIYKRVFDFLRINWVEILKHNYIQATKTILGINPDFLRESTTSGYYIQIDSDINTIHMVKEN